MHSVGFCLFYSQSDHRYNVNTRIFQSGTESAFQAVPRGFDSRYPLKSKTRRTCHETHRPNKRRDTSGSVRMGLSGSNSGWANDKRVPTPYARIGYTHSPSELGGKGSSPGMV